MLCTHEKDEGVGVWLCVHMRMQGVMRLCAHIRMRIQVLFFALGHFEHSYLLQSSLQWTEPSQSSVESYL